MDLDQKRWKKRVTTAAEKALKVAAEAADVLVHLKGRPTPLVGLSLGAKVIDTYKKVNEDAGTRYFRDWYYLERPPLLVHIWKQLRAQNMLVHTVGQTPEAYLCEVHGITMGWLQHSSWVEGPWVQTREERASATQALARFLWETHGPRIRLRATTEGAEVTKDYLTDYAPSPTADDVWSRLEALRSQGKHRAVLFYGEAGVGKSYIMRDVAQRAGGLSLRLHFEDFDKWHDIASYIDFLRPSVLLLDDVDRASSPGAIMAHFEDIKKVCTLFLAAVNDVTKLDPATLRPGRFDDLIEITEMDDAVFHRLTKGLSSGSKRELRSMPAAYIQEFLDLQKSFGEEQALKEVKELQERRTRIEELLKDN